MRLFLVFAGFFVISLSLGQDTTEKMGLLVMAHGGSEDWNKAIKEAVTPLRSNGPVAIAFGMANPKTLQEAVDNLVDQGATSVGVVRLFVSGDSFLPETEYAFGLRTEKPDGHFMHDPERIQLSIPVKISKYGLLDAVELGSILAGRAKLLSRSPASESVLIVGHGPGDDVENERWLFQMNQFADSVRSFASFHDVKVATLREDWTGKREVAELEMKGFVKSETAAGRTVLIIPFRLFGFGPYAEVFKNHTYRADSLGFLPDKRISSWIDARFQRLKGMDSDQ